MNVKKHFDLTLGYPRNEQIHFLKKLFFKMKMTELANMRLEHVAQLATSRADWLWPNDVFGLKQNVNNKYQNLMVTRKVNLQPST